MSAPSSRVVRTGLGWLLAPSPFLLHEWRRWARPWRLAYWPFEFGIMALWLSPILILFLGEMLLFPFENAIELMVAVPSLLVLFVSMGFVFSWWPRSATQGTFAELLVTPTPPIEFVRSALFPPRMLLAGGCALLVLLMPVSGLIVSITGKSYLAGDWATFLFAVNCILCAWFDPAILVWLFARLCSPLRVLVYAPFALLPLHAAFLVHAGLPFGKTLAPDLRMLVAAILVGWQIVFCAVVARDLPGRLDRWARERAERAE